MPIDFSLTVFLSICNVMYSFGEKIKINKKKQQQQKKNNTFLRVKVNLNTIFGQVLVRVWRMWSTRLINTQEVEIS